LKLEDDCSIKIDECSTGLVCAWDIVDENDENQMSICIPADRCGIDEVYESEELGIDFVIIPTTECVLSSADVTVEGEDCSAKIDGCASGLVCARDIVDENNQN